MPKPPLESKARDVLCNALRFHAVWHIKTTSSGMQRRGIPDILGVQNGQGFAVELKRDRGYDATPLQRKELEEFAASGGLALIARGRKGAEQALQAILGGKLETNEWLEKVSPSSSRS